MVAVRPAPFSIKATRKATPHSGGSPAADRSGTVKRFGQLVEQPRVLDGDDGLVCEVLHQPDLLVSERADLLAVDGNGADQLIFLEHGNAENGAVTAALDGGNHKRIAPEVALQLGDVGNLRACLVSAACPRLDSGAGRTAASR